MLADTEYAEPTTPLKIFQEGERASYSSATTKRLICVLEFADEKEKNLRTLPKTLFAILWRNNLADDGNEMKLRCYAINLPQRFPFVTFLLPNS